MDSKEQKNIVLYDWLSFTSKQHTPEELIQALGLEECPWTETKGARGYMDRLYFGCISIHYNGREDMGVWCEMSGQGCRNFEDLTTLPGKWDELLHFIHENALHMTRLDVAYDDHTGILDIDKLAQDTQDQHFISRMRYWETVRSANGVSVMIGSPQSKTRIRIYDKAAERGVAPVLRAGRLAVEQGERALHLALVVDGELFGPTGHDGRVDAQGVELGRDPLGPAALGQAAAHHAFAHAERACDLGGRHALVVVQHGRNTVVLGQAADRIPQRKVVFVLRAARKRLQIIRIGHARAFAAVFVCAVDRDLDEPAFERPFVTQAAEGLPRA